MVDAQSPTGFVLGTERIQTEKLLPIQSKSKGSTLVLHFLYCSSFFLLVLRVLMSSNLSAMLDLITPEF